MKSKISILIAVLALALVACLENDIEYNTDNLEYRPLEFGVPIGKIHATLLDGLEKVMGEDFKGELYVNDDDVICIKYTDTEKIEWTNDIGINNFNSNTFDINSWPPLMNIPTPDVSIDGSKIYEITLTTGEGTDTYVSEAEFSAGTFNIFVSMPTSLTSWSITVTIPEMKKDGVSFTHIFTDQLLPSLNENLNGYKFSTNTKNMKLNCLYNVTGSTSPENATIACSFSGIEVTYMKGYFGQLEYDMNMEMDVDFFDDLDFDGTIGIKDVSFEASLKNWIGIPFLIDAKKIGYLNEDNVFTELIKPPFNLLVPSAEETDNINHTVEAGITLRPQKLEEILFEPGNYPTGIVFDFSGKINPYNDGEEGTNFIVKSNTNLADAKITLNIPLHINVANYNRSDTLDFDYNELVGNNVDEDKTVYVEYVYFNLLVDNSLPFDLRMKAFAINKSGSLEIPIMDENILANLKEQRIEIKLEKDQLDQFRTESVKNIVLKSAVQTENQEYVKVKNDACLSIDASVRVKADIISIILNQ